MAVGTACELWPVLSGGVWSLDTGGEAPGDSLINTVILRIPTPTVYSCSCFARRPSPARGTIPPAIRNAVPRGVSKGGALKLGFKLAASHGGGLGCTSSKPTRLVFAASARKDCEWLSIATKPSRSAPLARRRRRITFRQPPGLHIPWCFSLAVRTLRAWQIGPVTPAFRPMCDSAGSGQVKAKHRGIDRHASMATGRRSVHCRPKGGGVMHHRLSCGKLDQPIESGPVVHDASCIMRRRVRSRSVACES